MRINLLLAAAMLILVFPRSSPAAPAGEVPFDVDRQGRIIVRVTVGDVASVPFLLDTGSTASALASELADRLALRRVGRTLVVSAGGSQPQDLVVLPAVSLGIMSASNLVASVIEHGAFRRAGIDVQGILGQDFLSQFDFTLDYGRRRLAWDEDATGGTALEPSARLSLVAIEQRLIARLPCVTVDEPALLLVPDSGAGGLVLFDTPATRRLGVQPLQGSYAVGGLSGSRNARAVRLRELRVGGVRIKNQQAVLVTPDTDAETVADGLLPLHLFARVSFRSRERELLLWQK